MKVEKDIIQDNIPVGCIPPAHPRYGRGCTYFQGGGVCILRVYLLLGGDVCLLGLYLLRGVYLPLIGGVPASRGYVCLLGEAHISRRWCAYFREGGRLPTRGWCAYFSGCLSTKGSVPTFGDLTQTHTQTHTHLGKTTPRGQTMGWTTAPRMDHTPPGQTIPSRDGPHSPHQDRSRLVPGQTMGPETGSDINAPLPQTLFASGKNS